MFYYSPQVPNFTPFTVSLTDAAPPPPPKKKKKKKKKKKRKKEIIKIRKLKVTKLQYVVIYVCDL